MAQPSKPKQPRPQQPSPKRDNPSKIDTGRDRPIIPNHVEPDRPWPRK